MASMPSAAPAVAAPAAAAAPAGKTEASKREYTPAAVQLEVCMHSTILNGFTTAFAVLHLVTLTIKNGTLHGNDHLVQFLAVDCKLLRDNRVLIQCSNNRGLIHSAMIMGVSYTVQ